MTSVQSVLDYLKVPTKLEHERTVWINDDLRPLPPYRRTWNKLAFFSFQAINQICISNWQVGASLVAIGLSVWQTMIAVIIAKLIIAMVCVANGYVGGKWHIGYPVFSRVVWGIYGSYLAIAQRILLSLVWYSVQSWFGGLFVTAILSSIFPSFYHMHNSMPESTHMTTAQFVGWVVYNVVSIPILYIAPEKTKNIFAVMNSIAFFTLISMMIWALSTAHGAGPLLSQPAAVASGPELGWAIVQGITTVIGSIAVGLTNAADWARFARRPGDQVIGQSTAIVGFGTLMPLFGCLTTSATLKIYGTAIWNPPILILQWLDSDYNAKSRAAAFFAGSGLVISQLAINTVDNGFSLGMDLSGVFPTYINIRRGAYLGLVLSIIACPWYLLSSASTFISVLNSYSLFLGPMIGIQICDYWFIRKQRVQLSQLYSADRQGSYYYWCGLNWRTFVSWIVGWSPQLAGFIGTINPSIKVPIGAKHLYFLAFIVGFLISFLLYWALNTISPPKGAGEMDEQDVYGTFTPDEAQKLGVQMNLDALSMDEEKAGEIRVSQESVGKE